MRGVDCITSEFVRTISELSSENVSIIGLTLERILASNAILKGGVDVSFEFRYLPPNA
jgi:hypothetical protein